MTAVPIPDTVFPFAFALGLGLLLGLQREWADSKLAGIRTFPLIALLGAVCARLAESFGGALPAVGLATVAVLAVLGNWIKLSGGTSSPSLTTEVSMLLTFGLGAYSMVGDLTHVAVIAGAAMVLLQSKEPLHRAVDSLGDRDVHAIAQFALISLVLLPIVPDRVFGPFDVLNAREIWWMVVLIVGIGLAGYLGYKFFGRRRGALVGGLLGGLVSSTATTVSYARSAREDSDREQLAVVVMLLASTVVFARVLIEIAAVAPSHFWSMAPPVTALGLCMVLLCFAAWRGVGPLDEDAGSSPQNGTDIDLGNPSELRSAFVFAALYAGVLLAVAWAREQLGSGGLYAVAVLSGLTDMDAITLSTSRMVQDGRLDATDGRRLVVLASMSNLVFKLGIAAVLGTRGLGRRLGIYFGIALVAGGLIVGFWPG